MSFEFYLSVVGGMLVVMLMNLMMVMMMWGVRIVVMVLGTVGPHIHLSSTGSLRR